MKQRTVDAPAKQPGLTKLMDDAALKGAASKAAEALDAIQSAKNPGKWYLCGICGDQSCELSFYVEG